MKICSCCKQPKDLNEFYKDNSTKDGFQYTCKKCRRVWYLNNVAKNKNDVVGGLAKAQKNYRVKYPDRHKAICLAGKKKYVMDWMGILRERGMLHCVHCGYDSFFEALEYHHIIPALKGKNISKLLEYPATAERAKELDKVVCLCANCHRELHKHRWSLRVGIRPPEQQMRSAANG